MKAVLRFARLFRMEQGYDLRHFLIGQALTGFCSRTGIQPSVAAGMAIQAADAVIELLSGGTVSPEQETAVADGWTPKAWR